VNSPRKLRNGTTNSAGIPTFQVTSFNSDLGQSELAANRLYNSDAFITPCGYAQGNMGRNELRGFGFAQVDLAVRKVIPITERYRFSIGVEAFNALNHQNVTDIQTVGYRIASDTAHANMGTLTWQSGERPATSTILVNGTSVPQYVEDATAAFGSRTNANSSALSRERQIQAGVKLNF